MRILYRLAASCACVSAAFVVVPASATLLTYKFSTNYDVTTTPTASRASTLGGSLGFEGKSTTAGAPALAATITGWTATAASNSAAPGKTSYNVTQSYLAQWQYGLGVVSPNYDTYGSCSWADCGMHQIDGVGNSAGTKSFDFVQITFDKAVSLSLVSRAAYGEKLGSATYYDDDFSYGHGATANALKRNTALSSGALTSADANTDKSGALFTSMLDAQYAVDGECTKVQSLGICLDKDAPTRVGGTANQYNSSTVWWISASLFNPDNKPDAFKLYDFSVVYNDAPVTTAPLPEPASWAMMIGGFGLVGAALRRRRAQERLAAA